MKKTLLIALLALTGCASQGPVQCQEGQTILVTHTAGHMSQPVGSMKDAHLVWHPEKITTSCK